jgi:hypothetical protein
VQHSDLQNQKYFAIIISESEREIKRDYTLAQGNLQSKKIFKNFQKNLDNLIKI